MDYKNFKNKYIIEGELEVETALHIGSGKVEGDFDGAFIKSGDRGYYIPGSSMKGYLRSKVEGLLVESPFGLKAQGELLNEGDVLSIFGFTSSDLKGKKEIEERLEKIFGKKYANFASKVHIEDMEIMTQTQEAIRDGIKISRKTGATVKGAKFDYNVIEKGNKFKFIMTLENIEDYQIEILMLGLKELQNGDLFGGKISRGIGKCKLLINSCSYIDISNKESLKDYIFNGKMKNKDIKSLEKISKITM